MLLDDGQTAALHAGGVLGTERAIRVIRTLGDARLAQHAGARAEDRAGLARVAALVLISVVGNDLDAVRVAGDQADFEPQLRAVLLTDGARVGGNRIGLRGEVPVVGRGVRRRGRSDVARVLRRALPRAEDGNR